MSKEIMIDGVDVSGCIYYNAEKLANCGMFTLGDFKCQGQICLYKQLKRLEQENEELKIERDMYKTFYRAKHNDVKNLFIKYRKTLKEIRETAKDNYTANSHKFFKIEELINEVLDEY